MGKFRSILLSITLLVVDTKSDVTEVGWLVCSISIPRYCDVSLCCLLGEAVAHYMQGVHCRTVHGSCAQGDAKGIANTSSRVSFRRGGGGAFAPPLENCLPPLDLVVYCKEASDGVKCALRAPEIPKFSWGGPPHPPLKSTLVCVLPYSR